MIGKHYAAILKAKRMAAFKRLQESLFERKVQRLIPAIAAIGAIAGLLLAVL